MPMSKTERIARKLSHTKQERLQISNGMPSVNDLRSSVPVIRSTTEGLVEYVRHNNTVYKKVLDKDISISRHTTETQAKSLNIIPIFQAYVGSSQGDVAEDDEVKLEINTVSIDTMSSYNTSSYLYTVSVSGIYYLYYNITLSGLDTAMSMAQVYMKDSGGNRFAICRIDDKEFSADTSYVNKTAQVIRQLTVGETIAVYYYQSGGDEQVDVIQSTNATSTGAESIFGGYLLTEPKSIRNVNVE